MSAYAIAHLETVDLNAEVTDYLLRIDETLPPFGGRWLVHGDVPEVLDGEFAGVVVVIGFPDVAAAHAWYASPGYQAIARYRIDNSTGGAIIVPGVPDGYRAASFVTKQPA